ncbi:MAG: chorismate mutase, partial [Eubacteriales bacterium]|nr:chorismate mutase [Eubacteriales bacterium]
MKSTFGRKIRTTVYGGSHEPFVGVSIEGLPLDFTPKMDKLQIFLNRRAPGRSDYTSHRREDDIPSLVKDEIRLGSRTLEYLIPNKDTRPRDYDKFRTVPRPGHADYTARLRYGDSINMSGGGPFSGRMTVALCLAGGLALQVLEDMGIKVAAKLCRINRNTDADYFRSESFISALRQAWESGDSIGGIVECTATGVPAGIGGAMYDGLEGILSEILFGIPAVKGVEFGAGFRLADMKGSEANDEFYYDGQVANNLPALKTRTNNCGGILGGITTGMPVICRVAFKPTPSISIPQRSVNLETGRSETLIIEGRHDPCVAVRAIPAVEAAMALGLLDAIYMKEAETGSALTSTCDSLSDTGDGRASHSGGKLEVLRDEIDKIDNEILKLIQRRTDISTQVAKTKKAAGLPLRNPQREAEILDRISNESSTELKDFVPQIFSTLFAASRKKQEIYLKKNQGLFGLIGAPLKHSFSKEIHEALGEYDFRLFDVNEEEMAQ